MKTIYLSPIETAIHQALRGWDHETLRGWDHKFQSWGMAWFYENTDGDRYEVAYNRDRNEIHVYLPNQGVMGPHRVIHLEEWKAYDEEPFATPETVADHLKDLPGW